MAERVAAAAERVRVRFAGAGSGTGPLSWGQQELWDVMAGKQVWLPVGAVLPLPPGTTVDDAAADLRFLMASYPSMRTRLRLAPGGTRQVVAGSGETELAVVDAGDDEDPAAVAEQVRKHYWRRDFPDVDFTSEWPVRVAVIRHRGVLTHRVTVMSHLVTDGFGSRVIIEERAAGYDASGSRAALSPLQQARWQQSPAGQRQSRIALRHWEQVLRGVPARRFPERAETPHPRYWQAESRSPATHLAARVIAARTGVGMSSVLLALFAVSLARATGTNPIVVVLTVSNRFRPGLARTVSPIMHPGICVLDLPDGTVDEAMTLTRRRALTAYKHAYYHPGRRDELIERVNRERGEQVDLECSFNDRRLKPRDESLPLPTAGQIRAALGQDRFTWTYQQDEREFDHLYVNVDDMPDTVQLTLVTDVHVVAPEAVTACVRGMEEVAVAAALDPAARAGVPAPGGGP